MVRKCYVLKGHNLVTNSTWVVGVCTSMKKAKHYEEVLVKKNNDDKIIYSVITEILL